MTEKPERKQMRIIHTADIHLDSPMTAHLSPSKISERRRELAEVFPRLAEEAVRIGASAIIIAGDLFDGRRVSKKAIDLAIGTAEKTPGVTFLYLPGNHEGDLLREEGVSLPKNFLIFGKDWTYFECGGVMIAGRYECSADMFDTLRLKPGQKNIAVLHGELRERCSGRDVIGRVEMRSRGLDYVALGHYHSYSAEVIDDRAVAVYSGAPEGRGFDEVGDKGYVLIETDETAVRHRFVPFAKRRLHTVEVDTANLEKATELATRVEISVKDIPATDMVRVRLVGRCLPELWKDTAAIKRRLCDRFFYGDAEDASLPEPNVEGLKNDRSLKGEFIRRVMACEDIDEKEKAKIISCGIYALMGESYFDV